MLAVLRREIGRDEKGGDVRRERRDGLIGNKERPYKNNDIGT